MAITPTRRRYGQKASGMPSSPVIPGTTEVRISRQRGLLSSETGGTNEPVDFFTRDEGDEVDVPATDEEETFPSRAAGSSTLS
jgi:hypothetical protein